MLKPDLDKTGNDVETTPSLPEYWAVMVECLGDRFGLSQLSLGESEPQTLEALELSDESESVASTDKRRLSETLASGKRNGKERGIEIMASAMKEGMSEMAEAMKARAGGTGLEKMEKMMEGFAETQRQLVTTLQALCAVMSNNNNNK